MTIYLNFSVLFDEIKENLSRKSTFNQVRRRIMSLTKKFLKKINY